MFFFLCPSNVDLWCLKSRQHGKKNQILVVFFSFLLSSLCKGRTLYSVVRDAKVVLDVNKTRQIAQEMVKVKQLSTDSPATLLQYTSYYRKITTHSLFLSLSICREWATSTLRGFYTKIWSPRMCFMTTARLSSPTLDSSPYLECCRLAGNYGHYT